MRAIERAQQLIVRCDGQAQSFEIERHRTLPQQAQHDAFAKGCRRRRDANVDISATRCQADAAILGDLGYMRPACPSWPPIDRHGARSADFFQAARLLTSLMIGVIVLVGALTFFPALLLGPIVQGLTPHLY